MISKILVAYNYSYNAASDWPHTFLQPGCFYLAYAVTLNNFCNLLNRPQSITVPIQQLSVDINKLCVGIPSFLQHILLALSSLHFF